MEVDEGGKDIAQGPVKAVTGKKSGKRMSAASRMSRSDRHSLRTYDELIEGRDEAAVAFPDDLDFQFLVLIQVIITPLYISTDKSDLPLVLDCGVCSGIFHQTSFMYSCKS